MVYAQKITLGEVRGMGVRRLLVYCRDHKCSHSIIISADRWSDGMRRSPDAQIPRKLECN
jgi:hypothetical protein